MENASRAAIPKEALRRLECLSGEYTGVQTLYPPGGGRVSYPAFCTITHEACDRFFKVEFVADIPGFGVESFTSFLTYSCRKGKYMMWLFSSSAEEPLQMTGDYDEDRLVLISDPWDMPWGLQRLRSTLVQRGEDTFQYVTELWEPDGYVTFRSTVFQKSPVEL